MCDALGSKSSKIATTAAIATATVALSQNVTTQSSTAPEVRLFETMEAPLLQEGDQLSSRFLGRDL